MTQACDSGTEADISLSIIHAMMSQTRSCNGWHLISGRCANDSRDLRVGTQLRGRNRTASSDVLASLDCRDGRNLTTMAHAKLVWQWLTSLQPHLFHARGSSDLAAQPSVSAHHSMSGHPWFAALDGRSAECHHGSARRARVSAFVIGVGRL